MPRLTIAQLAKLTTVADETSIRIWDENEDKPIDCKLTDCPKQYLHKPITDWTAGHYALVLYF